MKKKVYSQKLKEHAFIINNELKKLFPCAEIMLTYSNPWELLVAVMLSAQSTDKTVNKVTPVLFSKYKTLDDYVNADIKEFEKDIFSTGFYHVKAKHILEAARIIKNTFKGIVPKTMKEILTLPGVARKTANVVLSNAYNVIEGIAVDTHVKRLANVLGLSKEHDSDKIEQDLMVLIPKSDWKEFTYRMIEYGRKYCTGRRHEHDICPLMRVTGNKSNIKS